MAKLVIDVDFDTLTCTYTEGEYLGAMEDIDWEAWDADFADELANCWD